MRKDDRKQKLVLFLIGGFVAAWLGLLLAPFAQGGLMGLVNGAGSALQDPFKITLCESSARAVLIALLIYLIAAGCIVSSGRNYRRSEEFGSARWGDPQRMNRKYASSKTADNRLLTENVSFGLNTRRHGRNLNTIVCGGSGSGKTRFYAKPNIMQANSSYVVLDPKRAVF